MAVSSGFGQPEVEEYPSGNSCPTIIEQCDVQGLSQKFAKASSGVPNW